MAGAASVGAGYFARRICVVPLRREVPGQELLDNCECAGPSHRCRSSSGRTIAVVAMRCPAIDRCRSETAGKSAGRRFWTGRDANSADRHRSETSKRPDLQNQM